MALGLPVELEVGLPPRGRGNLALAERGPIARGSTPAWAGQPPTGAFVTLSTSVYPRVGGATDWKGKDVERLTGLPPRGRGNPRDVVLSARSGGSTPAWAGQPRTASVLHRGPRVYPRVGGATWVVR